jgi:hypothetical protein
VGPGAVLDAVVKRKIPSPRRESNPRTPILQPVAQRHTDQAITARRGLVHTVNIIYILQITRIIYSFILWIVTPG